MPGMFSKNPAERLAHVRPVRPLHFPVSEPAGEHLGQSRRHWDLCMLLAFLVRRIVTPAHSYGADQFVYWNARDSRRCLAPDVFVKLGVPDEQFDSWKTWERGAPELGVEIISASDQRDDDWDEKLARYRAAGIPEIVRFDAEDRTRPIRIWDHVSGDVVERAPDDPDLLFCHALGLWWVVLDDPAYGPMLRLARDREGRDPLPTPDERRVLAERAKRDAEQMLHDETEARRRAESEIERLKEALAKAQRGE